MRRYRFAKIMSGVAALVAAPLFAYSLPVQQAAPAPSTAAPARPPTLRAEVLARLPHDTNAFTEGLFFRDGKFFESTGQIGISDIREVDPATGKVLRRVAIDPSLFGEGITDWKDQILSVTWKSGKGFRWKRDSLKPVGSFRYPGQGWGMTSSPDSIILSDGTPQLRFIDPKDFSEKRRLTVTFRGDPINNLNELEWVDGTILANVWRVNAIIQIDPKSGAVMKVIDLDPLAREIHATDPDSVPNGIAWDAKRRRLFVTGKNWPTIFQIAWPAPPATN